MTDRDHRYYRELLGVYVLGHLEAGEERELQSHLQRCASCRAEAEELGATVATLSAHPEVGHTSDTTQTTQTAETYKTGEVESSSPPSELEDRIVAAATGDPVGQRTRSRRRWLTVPRLAAASVASLAVVVLVVAAILVIPTEPENPGLGDVEPISFTTEPEDISADGEVVAHTWGTEVILQMEGLEEGELYKVDVLREDGTVVSAGTLIGDSDMPVECNLNGAILRENAEALSVRDSEGALVLRSDLDGP